MLGRSLGNYEVVSKIGEGGMGVVYLARHVTLGRRAAIKVIRPALSSDQDIVSRFFKEARAATSVRHPGIVEVYDFGFLEDRTAYIIMEYLEGESLAARLRRGRPAIEVTLTIVHAIARALQAAHQQGIVHRDLKPDNVFLVPDSELPSGERVKLLDFGIAKLAYDVGDVGHTKTGIVIGTPAYMSPEQCRGAASVDRRADLYSLGCAAYEMLCGQPPFIADAPADVVACHLCFEPSPPRSHRSDISPELEGVILRLLQKEPRDRYGTAADLIRALDQLPLVATPEVATNEQTMSGRAATLPTTNQVSEKTTLSGAASSSVTPRTGPKRSRLRIVVGAAAVAFAFLVVILFAHGTRNDEVDGEYGGGRIPHRAKGAGEQSTLLSPAPPAVTSPSVESVTSGAPSAVSGPRVDRAQAPTPTSPGGTGGDSVTRPNSDAPTSKPSKARSLPAPVNPAPPATPGDTKRPGDPAKRTVITASTAESSNSASITFDRIDMKSENTAGPDQDRRSGPHRVSNPIMSKVTSAVPVQLSCSSPDELGASGQSFRIQCEAGNHGDYPIGDLTYHIAIGKAAAVMAAGPTVLGPHALRKFELSLLLPPEAESGASVPVTVTMNARNAPPVEQKISVQIVEPYKLCNQGEYTIQDYRRKRKGLEEERIAGNITQRQFNDLLAELWSCVRH